MRFSLLFSFLFIIPQLLVAEKQVIIRGKISSSNTEQIHIRNIKHYKDYFKIKKVYFASSEIDSDGKFEMKFTVKRSMPVEINYGNNKMELFVFPGAILQINGNAKKFEESLTFDGIGKEFNTFLVKHYTKFESPKAIAKLEENIRKLTTDDFVKFNDKRKKEQTDMLNSFFKGSVPSTFKKYMLINIEYDWANNFLKFFNYALQRNIPVDTSRYAFLKEIQIENTKAFTSSKYLDFLNSYTNNLYYKDCAEKNRIGLEIDSSKYFYEQYKIRLVYFSNEKIKELLLAKIIADAIEADNLEKISHHIDRMLRNYRKVSKNKKFFKVLLKKYRTVNKLAPGNPAPNFTYKDLNGNEVSLTDFKGKVIYIDVWASWCGICRKEIPILKKLEEKFNGKNVEFIYVSIDRVEKMWRKIISDNNLQGINLFTGDHFDSQIVNDYNIQSVPHYILIDQNGTVVENRTKKPTERVERDIQLLLNRN